MSVIEQRQQPSRRLPAFRLEAENGDLLFHCRSCNEYVSASQFTASAISYKRHYCKLCMQALVRASKRKRRQQRSSRTSATTTTTRTTDVSLVNSRSDEEQESGPGILSINHGRAISTYARQRFASPLMQRHMYNSFKLRLKRAQACQQPKNKTLPPFVAFTSSSITTIMFFWNYQSAISSELLLDSQLEQQQPCLAVWSTDADLAVLEIHDVVPVTKQEGQLLRRYRTVEERRLLLGSERVDRICDKLRQIKEARVILNTQEE